MRQVFKLTTRVLLISAPSLSNHDPSTVSHPKIQCRSYRDNPKQLLIQRTKTKMCISATIVYGCGCATKEPVRRCRKAIEATKAFLKRRWFERSSTKAKRQLEFEREFTKDGNCKVLNETIYPSVLMCKRHENENGGRQRLPRTNPLLTERNDGLVFREVNSYDGSGRTFRRQELPTAPRPTYHFQGPSRRREEASVPRNAFSTATTTATAHPTRSNRDRWPVPPPEPPLGDRLMEARSERLLKEVRRVERDRGEPIPRLRKPTENIRNQAIARALDQRHHLPQKKQQRKQEEEEEYAAYNTQRQPRQLQPLPVPSGTLTSLSWDCVPEPLFSAKKEKNPMRTTKTATTAKPISMPSSSRQHARPTHAGSSSQDRVRRAARIDVHDEFILKQMLRDGGDFDDKFVSLDEPYHYRPTNPETYPEPDLSKYNNGGNNMSVNARGKRPMPPSQERYMRNRR